MAQKPTRAARMIVGALIALVTVGALAVPLYNRVDPTLAGIPFFYWFQVIWIFAAAAATAVAYRLKI